MGKGGGHGLLRFEDPMWSGQADRARSGLRVLRSMSWMALGDTVTTQLYRFPGVSFKLCSEAQREPNVQIGKLGLASLIPRHLPPVAASHLRWVDGWCAACWRLGMGFLCLVCVCAVRKCLLPLVVQWPHGLFIIVMWTPPPSFSPFFLFDKFTNNNCCESFQVHLLCAAA